MTKLKEFHIEFDKPSAIYYPGEIVSGKIVVMLTGSKNVREVRFKAHGEAQVHWTKNRSVKDSSGRSHQVTDHYQGSEEYFNVSNRLAGDASGNTLTTLTSGKHVYQFSFQLPQQIPSSFQHQYGSVRYYVKAVLDRPWRFDHQVEAPFTVVATHDLNKQPLLAVGLDEEKRQKFSWFCCIKFGEMKVNVRSKATGFVPGETIEFIVNHDVNSTRVDVTKIKMKLEQSVQFYASTPSPTGRTETEIIKKTKVYGPFGKKGETSLKLEVPQLPPSRLEFCSIISVSYKLRVQACVSGIHYNFNKMYPIEIGNVPIYREATNPTPNSSANYAPSAPLMCDADPNFNQVPLSTVQPIGFVFVGVPPNATSTPNAKPEMLPPSYEECVSGKNNSINQNEGINTSNVQVTPSYPVYKFPMPQPYQ